jgi:hypothetical protein
MLSSRIRPFSKSASRDSRFKRRSMRSPRYGRDEENDDQGDLVKRIRTFLRKRLGPEDFAQLEQILSSEDMGGMEDPEDSLEPGEDEADYPPYYGEYGENVKGPLDFSSKEKRFQGRYQGGADSRLRTPSARAVNEYNTRFPDAARLR